MATVLPLGVKWQMPLCGVYPLVSKKSDVSEFTIGMIKKVIHSTAKPLILQHDVDTDVSLTYLSGFSINQGTVSLYELIIKKS